MRISNPVLVFDTETTLVPGATKVSGPGGQANPYGGSRAVYMGVEYRGKYSLYVAQGFIGGEHNLRDSLLAALRACPPGSTPVLVGHNMGFDLHHTLFAGGGTLDDVPAFTIWDTQLAHYYLQGQRPESRMNKLNYLLEKYGRPPKDSRISEYFRAGIGADKIPPDEILPYLKDDDVMGTKHVFEAQFAEAADLGMLPFLRDMLDAQLLCIMMENTGLDITPEAVDALRAELADDYAQLRSDMDAEVAGHMPKHPAPNAESNQQVLAVLTGGSYKYKKSVLVGKYKNGKDKYNMTDLEATAEPFSAVPDITGTGEDVLLKTIVHFNAANCNDGATFCERILKLRDLSKKLGTYVNGYFGKVDEHGVLRTSYSHSITPTGRLSSSNPNLQNLPKRKDT